MKKNIIIIILSILLCVSLVFGAKLIIEKNNNIEVEKELKNENEVIENTNDKREEISFKQMYSEYLTSNILNNENIVNGYFIDIENDSQPELIIKHQDNQKLKVLYVDGDSIQETEDYDNSNIVLLYDVKTENPIYGIQNNNEIVVIKNLINNQQTGIIQEKDSEYNYLYVKEDIVLNYYTISSEFVEDDIEKVNNKSKDVITDEIENDAKLKIKNIKDNELTKNDNGISNKNYSIVFGDYVNGGSTLTLRKDYSATHAIFHGYTDTYNGSYNIFHDMITTNGIYTDNFRIKDNNILENVKDGSVWALKK